MFVDKSQCHTTTMLKSLSALVIDQVLHKMTSDRRL